MNPRVRRRLAAMAIASLVSSWASAAPRIIYEVTDLGTLMPHRHHGGLGVAINDAGNIVGRVGRSAIVTNQKADAIRARLEADGLAFSPKAINEDGTIAGAQCKGGSGDCVPFSADKDGRHVLVLDSLPGCTYSYAAGINADARIVGTGWALVNGAWVLHAFAAQPHSRQVTDLGTLGGSQASADAINDAGIIVGSASIPGDIEMHAFMIDGSGVMRDMGFNGEAMAVNVTGQIAGYAYVGGPAKAFITGPDGTGARFLVPLDGAQFTALTSINSSGQAVGWEQAEVDGVYTDIALVTDRHGKTLHRLGALANLPKHVTLVAPSSINDRGEIITNGTNHHVYLLRPTRKQP